MFRKIIVIVYVVLYFKVGDFFGYNGSIAGNKSISECITGIEGKYTNLTIPSEFIRAEGYLVEDHLILTEDGYLLTLNRIPGPAGAPIVIVHHGYSGTSFDWIFAGKNRGLAFLLADEGYDVWLANARGGRYSRCHVKYKSSEYIFWDFTFHEMGMYDIPAEINYISKIQNGDIFIVGHSIGNTAALITATERPDVASKIKVIFCFAPTAFMSHIKGPLRYLAPLTPLYDIFTRIIYKGQIFRQDILREFLIEYVCSLTVVQRKFCLFFVFLGVGFDYAQIDYSLLPLSWHHDLAPIAAKIATHYGQLINSGKFRYFDHGIIGNLKAYKTIFPPEYNLSKVQVPVALLWGENDNIADPTDVKRLHDILRSKTWFYKVPYPYFNHIDFTYGIEAPKLVYSKVISIINDHKNNK